MRAAPPVVHWNARGFNLLELLLVASIVSLLAALTVSGVRHASQLAKRSACASHLYQNGIGIIGHLNEHRQRYPSFFFNVYGEPVDGPIDVEVVQRTREQAGFNYNGAEVVCPADDKPGVIALVNPGPDPDLIYQQVSYGYNINLLSPGTTHDALRWPSRNAVLFDGAMNGPVPGVAAGKDVQGSYDDVMHFAQYAATFRHRTASSAANALFADGHVASLTLAVEQIDVNGKLKAKYPNGRGKSNEKNPNAGGGSGRLAAVGYSMSAAD